MAVPKLITSNEIKIEKGIPIPESRARAKPKYPFGSMDVGDSFGLPDADVLKVRSAAGVHARRSPSAVKFTVLRTQEGARCWRIV